MIPVILIKSYYFDFQFYTKTPRRSSISTLKPESDAHINRNGADLLFKAIAK